MDFSPRSVRIPAFIATLGTALVIRGVAFVSTEGRSIGLSGESGDLLEELGRGFIGPLPVPVIVMIVLYGVATWVMSRTTWGLHTYAVGSAEKAARIAGVRVTRHRIEVYAVGGLLAGLAGVVLAGRLDQRHPGWPLAPSSTSSPRSSWVAHPSMADAATSCERWFGRSSSQP